MAQRLSMDFTALTQSANKYKSGAQDIQQVLKALTDEQKNILDIWQGEASVQFDAQFQELRPKVQAFAELLEQINEQLIKTAEILEMTDRELSKNFGFQ